MSAALQSAPRQPSSVPALNTSPLVTASPASRHHPSPTRETYNANTHPSGASSSSSSRRPSRRPSANDSPSGHNSPMSSRAAVASPVPVTAAPSDYYPSPSSERRKNMPTAVPPRTSSTQHASGATGSSSRRVHGGERAANSPRRAHADPNGSAVDPEEASAQASRSRRAQQIAQEPPQRTSSTRDGRTGSSAAALPTRTQQAPNSQASPKGPSREASEILNSILVSQDEVDIAREQQRLAMAQPQHPESLQDDDAVPPPIAQDNGEESSRRGGRSRHDHSKREKHTKFGEYILGSTIGEGEFGKVKLGWKQEGGVQVAIKLIKKDQLGSNPSRMAKIRREVAILQQLSHPNIVKLHKMEESERHFGIVLEYASGGELFDYILNHRYLKDNAARRLFAQLVSGVGYLHKKGIVHRDLKLENLLLDRNRNIIITDFGFANTFDPIEELTEEEELNLTDRDYVKRSGLDKVKPNGSRKGDLMQTSCGSPCYAAPELVVSDSLYTGRKVDVWSCGVILYAMLAGYLPFDDDPANPEGDNINLLYKYIVNTPLTFPEYVTPHARDLLRRILVPNPRKRADLFEVARHSWLSEWAHVVELVTSSTTTSTEIQNTTVPAEDEAEPPAIVRSSSVRESSKKTPVSPPIGGLASKQGTIDPDAEAVARQQRENKRRTVQVEYVAPSTATQRGEAAGGQSSGKTRARSGSQGPVEVAQSSSTSPKEKPLPRDPPASREGYGQPMSSRKPPSAHRNQPVQGRPNRGEARAISDTAFMTVTGSAARPATGGSMQSTGSRGVGAAGARASIQQPAKGSAKNYSGVPQEQQNPEHGRPSISMPPKFVQVAGFPGEGESAAEVKGHRRSSTMGEIGGKLFGRTGSLFGGRSRKRSEQQPAGEKTKKYPPVSMTAAMLNNNDEPRPSMDSKRSRRSFSAGLGKKRSGSMTGSQNSQEKQNRRFSFIPGSFSLRAIGIGKDYGPSQDSQQDLPIQEPPIVDQYGRYVDQDVGRDHVEAATLDGMYAQLQDTRQQQQSQQAEPSQWGGRPAAIPNYMPGAVLNTGSESSIDQTRRPPGSAPHQPPYPAQHDGAMDQRRVASSNARGNRGVLTKNKRFVDAWDTDDYSRPHDHSGSSGPARKVMDFFRRRGKARGGNS